MRTETDRSSIKTISSHLEEVETWRTLDGGGEGDQRVAGDLGVAEAGRRLQQRKDAETTANINVSSTWRFVEKRDDYFFQAVFISFQRYKIPQNNTLHIRMDL